MAEPRTVKVSIPSTRSTEVGCAVVTVTASSAGPDNRTAPAAPQPNKESLQALLTVIKRDLHDAAR